VDELTATPGWGQRAPPSPAQWSPSQSGGTGFICVWSEGEATTTDKLVEIAVENVGSGLQQQVRAARHLTH
jgi:hypothetical protein